MTVVDRNLCAWPPELLCKPIPQVVINRQWDGKRYGEGAPGAL
jgi:hypothetical protein